MGESWGDKEVYQCSSNESNHGCCSTYKDSFWMNCRSYTDSLSVQCLVALTFQLDVVLVGYLEISCWIPSVTCTVMNRTNVSIYSRSYNTNSSWQQWKAGCVRLWFYFLSQISWNHRCSKTPQSVTMKMDIKCLHSTRGHCYLLHFQLYSTAFEITNWIDNVNTTVFLFTYNVEQQISIKANQYDSNRWDIGLTTMPRWQCGSIR